MKRGHAELVTLTVLAVLVAGGCASRGASAADPVLPPLRPGSTVAVPPGPGSVPPPADPAPPAPVTSSSALPPTDAVAGLAGIQAGVNECLRLPAACKVAEWAVEGTQAYRALDEVLRYYLANSLVAQIVPELTYVVPLSVHMLGPDRAEITLCEVDGSWQMDSRRTRTTDDDIIWNDLVVSRRARHVLSRTDGRWRRTDIVELEFWPGENRCPPLVTV